MVGKRRGQLQYSDLAIETALTLRLVFRLPLRQTEGFLTSIFGMMGVDLAAPDHTTLSRRGHHLSVTLRSVPAQGGLHLIVDELLRRADAAAKRMPTGGEYETEGFGMLASTEKRKAEVQYQLGRALLPATESNETVARVFEASLASLRRAQAHYETAVQQNMAESSGAIKKKRSLHWVLTQHLSLRMVLGEPLLEDYWMAAKISAEVDRKLDSRTTRVWAEASLVELYALLMAYPKAGIMSASLAKAAALTSSRAVLTMAAGSFEMHSTRRQMRRYLDWWCDTEFQKQIGEPGGAPSKPGDDARGELRALRNTIGAIVKMFPEA